MTHRVCKVIGAEEIQGRIVADEINKHVNNRVVSPALLYKTFNVDKGELMVGLNKLERGHDGDVLMSNSFSDLGLSWSSHYNAPEFDNGKYIYTINRKVYTVTEDNIEKGIQLPGTISYKAKVGKLWKIEGKNTFFKTDFKKGDVLTLSDGLSGKIHSVKDNNELWLISNKFIEECDGCLSYFKGGKSSWTFYYPHFDGDRIVLRSEPSNFTRYPLLIDNNYRFVMMTIANNYIHIIPMMPWMDYPLNCKLVQYYSKSECSYVFNNTNYTWTGYIILPPSIQIIGEAVLISGYYI